MTSTLTGFSSRTVPWAFYGDGAVAIDGSKNLDEALELAGLDFDVDVRPAGWQDEDGKWRPHGGRAVVIREDLQQPLGSVSANYKPLQYSKAFGVVSAMQPDILAAGSHDGGKSAFVVVQDPQHRTIETLGGRDPHDLYVIVRTSHDASRGVEVALLPLRGKCANMLPLSGGLRNCEQRWAFRHSGKAEEHLKQAQRTLAGLDRYAAEFEDIVSRLADIDLDLDEARAVLDQVVPQELKSRDKRLDEILGVYKDSDTNGFQGTGWGLVNAVTEFYDHRAPSRATRPAARLLRGLDGVTAKAGNRVTNLLLSAN